MINCNRVVIFLPGGVLQFLFAYIYLIFKLDFLFMRPLFLLLAMSLLLHSAYAQKQKQEHYSRARIYLDDTHTINDLAANGIAVDHGEHKRNTYFTSDFSDRELAAVKKAGFKTEIIIEDVVKHYQQQNKKKAQKSTAVSCDFTPAIDIPAHFHLGSYAGGYFSYTEMLDILDSMQLLYPGIISVRKPIGTFATWQGNPIYWIRISNNPGTDQPAKPQMLYTALHHAREPGSLSALIFYMWHLLEHYATDPQIKTIIDNTELYFVPCVNPDGYIENVTYYPSGGGMRRKNLRDNLDGSFGVDLNRNYGYSWGYDNIGSSPVLANDTYRGPSAFSEPETQAIKWLAENHKFRFCLNYHSYHNDILYPWGYIPSFLTDDSDRFFNYGAFLTKENHYRYGTCNQVLGYVSNGDSNDWMYGDVSGKPKIFAFTPEVGSNDNGFYPPTTQIIPDCKNNVPANINIASLLLPYASITHTDKKILVSTTGYLHYSMQRLGFPDTATFTASVQPLDSWMTVSATPKVYTGLTMLQKVHDSISYTLLPGTPNGQLVRYVLKLNNGFYDIYDTVQFYYGRNYAITTPSANSLTDWSNSGWGLSTTEFYSAPAAIQSSTTGVDNYNNSSSVTITTTKPVDLTFAKHAYLNFYTKWAIETDYDYATVSAVISGSGMPQALCGRYTKVQPGSGIQMYDGQQPNWVQEEIDLQDYVGQKIDIQFDLNSDMKVNDRGFYFDDISVITVEDTPMSVHPIMGATGQIIVYPNPAHSDFTISAPGASPAQPISAVLYDCVGREVMQLHMDQPNTSVNTQQLPDALYYLKTFVHGQPTAVQKIVIAK